MPISWYEENLDASRFPPWGLLGMAAFLGSLEYVLEEGPGNDWFSDAGVAGFAVIMTIGAILFFYRAFAAKLPVVDLRAFSDVNFAFRSVFSFIMGVGLYGLSYLYPLYLSIVRGFSDALHGAHQQPGSGRPAARTHEERLRSFQPHPQSRRRGGSRGHQHDPQQSRRYALCAAGRKRELANRGALDTLENLSRTFSAQGLKKEEAAVSQLTAIVQQQAWVMSFIDVFWFMTALFVGLALAAILMKKPENPVAGGGH